MGTLEKYDFAAAELEYRAGGYSINALAAKHGIPEPTLRRYAKREGWTRGSSDVKRELVREAMAGLPLDEQVTNDLTNSAVRQIQLDEASQDVRDMNTGLSVARKCMDRLLAMVDAVDNPNDVKRIVEANKAAVETIRKIRALDDDTGPEASVEVELSDGFAELRAAFRKRLEQPVGASSDDADPT